MADATDDLAEAKRLANVLRNWAGALGSPILRRDLTAAANFLTRLKAAQPEHDRTVRLAALEEAAIWHERKAEETTTLARAGWHMIAAKGIRSLIDQTGGEGGI